VNVAADWRLAVAVGGAIGLAASPFWTAGGTWLKPLATLVLVATLFVDRGRLRGGSLLLVALCAALAGLLVGGARITAIDAGAMRAAPGPSSLSGFATESPSDSRGTARFIFDSGSGRVLVETASGQAERVVPGVGLEVHGELEPAPDWMRSDLRRKGVAMVLRADRLRLNGTTRGGVTGMIDRMRDRAFAALSVAVPDREAALSRGFVLGDDSDVDPSTVDDFRNSGLSHLLAVSGQNVVLLALLAMPLLALLGIGPRARLVVIAALIVLYVPLAGGGPSIQRAGVMGIAGLVAMGAGRAPSRAYALALAALVTLALNPRATGDIGWQLSFVAVVGIMLLARPLQLRFAPVVGDVGWRRALAEGIAVTLAATLATAPLIVFHFEGLPIGTLAANLAAMPAVAPSMWLGMIAVAAGQINSALAAPFNLVGSVCLAWIAQVAAWFGQPAWAVVELRIGSPLALALVTFLLIAAVLITLRLWRVPSAPARAARWIPGLVLTLAAAILLLPGLAGGGRRHLGAPPPGGARVEVLDVGQGDAILIRPAGADPLLIDGGPPGGDLAGALESADVGHLEAALLTHPDLDHYGGLLDLFGRIPTERFLYDRAPPELLSLARHSGAALDQVSAGNDVSDGNLSLEILWPLPGEEPVPASADGTETNLRSIAAVLRWRNFRMLLTGDAEAESVPMHPGPIDVLKVSHHGSEDAGLPALLDESHPRLAVISVGEDNRYGHPVPDVLNELAADRVKTLRTDRDGTISIVLSGNSWRVETGD
jgi:competence protein ComEC